MLPIQILYTLSSLAALSAGVPQIIKLLKTKSSEDFNLPTWMMWVGTQSVSAAYAFYIGDLLLIAMSSSWVLFYATITTLIIRFSPRRTTVRPAKTPPSALTTPTVVTAIQNEATHTV